MDCISIGAVAPLATQGKQIKPIAFERPELFQWSGRSLSPKLSKAYDQLRTVAPAGSGPDDPTSFIFRTACNAEYRLDAGA